MKDYTVAVIIPTLNEEFFIESCIHSIKKQTYPFEKMDVMVIDGGSKDKTRSIVQHMSDESPNIRLIDNPGKIQSIAFNIGVKESSAPYIVRLDAHASYDSHYIELCISHLKSDESYGNVGGICHILAPKKSIIAEANAILNKVKFGIGGAAFRVGTKSAFVDSVPFGAFSRTVIEKVGGMREDLARGEDNEINSRINKFGYKIFMDPAIVSTYYCRATAGGSAKQMYKNGLSIGKLLYIDRDSVGLRHMIPLLFVLALIFCFLFSWYTPIFYLGIVTLAAYSFAAFLATIDACIKFGAKYFIVLPWLFFLIHISYGWGTIIGILRGK